MYKKCGHFHSLCGVLISALHQRVFHASRDATGVDMDSESGEDLGALLESTLTLSRGLETLYSEHEVLLQALGEERGSDASNRAGDHG